MALRKCNIVAYRTSDGQKFIGGESKEAAKRHEDEIQEFLKEFRTAEFVFATCGIEEQLAEIDEEEILTHFSDMAKDDSDNGIRERFNDIVDDQMEKMLKNAQCADEISDIDDMLNMICDVIYDFGGIDAVVRLYNYNMKKRK